MEGRIKKSLACEDTRPNPRRKIDSVGWRIEVNKACSVMTEKSADKSGSRNNPS